MNSNCPSIERTLVIIKPDGVKRGLVGKITSKFENLGLKLVACRMVMATEKQARGNYPGTDEWLISAAEKTYKNYDNDTKQLLADLGTLDKREIGQKIYDALVKFLMSGPVILMVWEGNHAVSIIRKVAGATSPDIAAPGTIRGEWGFDTPMLATKTGRIVFQNIVHISDSAESAEVEIKNWFGDKYKYLGDYSRIDYVGSFEALS